MRSKQQRLWASIAVLMVVVAGSVVVRGGAARQLQNNGRGVGETFAERARMVLAGASAFLLGDAQMIAGSAIAGIAPSPAGRYVLVLRRQLPPLLSQAAFLDGPKPDDGEISLILWNARTRRADILWKRAAGAGAITDVRWLPGTDRAIAVSETITPSSGGKPDVRRALVLIDASRASLRPLTALGVGEMLNLSPAQPLAVLIQGYEKDGGDETFRLVRAGGTVSARIALPPSRAVPPAGYKTQFSSADVFWSEDGAAPYVAATTWFVTEPSVRPRKQVRVDRWFALNPRTAALSPLAEKPEGLAKSGASKVAPAANPPLRLAQTTVAAKKGDNTETLRPLWLEATGETSDPKDDEAPRALVAAHGQGGFVLADGSAVLYVSGGALYAVPLLRVDKTAFLQARRAAQRAATLSNAKQIAIALHMYAQDYDEVFPPAGGDTAGQIGPYLKNASVFNNPATGQPGFVFTLRGNGALAGIAAPAETVIGHVSGPGGRAIVYADGHVRWQDD